MPQVADLTVEVGINTKAAEAGLSKLEQTLATTGAKAEESGKKIDESFGPGLKESTRDAANEASKLSGSLGRVGQRAEQAADSARGMGKKLKDSMRDAAEQTEKAAEPFDLIEKEALQAESATQKLIRSFGKQKQRTLENAKAVGKLDKKNKENVSTLKQMRKQAEASRASLEKLFREGAIDAQQFERQLKSIDNALHKIGEVPALAPKPGVGASFMKVAAGIGVTVLGLKALSSAARGAVQFMKSSIAAAEVQEDAENSLAAALERTGNASAKFEQRLKDQASALQASTRFGDESIIRMQALGLSMGIGAKDIEGATAAALDMAAALGKDVEFAMRNMAKTTGGFAGELGELIPELKSLTVEELKAGKGIELLSKKFAGAAARDVQTFSGRVDQLGNSWGDAKEQFGFAVTESDDLKGAMGELSGTLPGLGTKLAELVEDLAPAIAASLELADGILGIMTAADQVDTGSLQGIAKDVGAAGQATLDAKTELAKYQRVLDQAELGMPGASQQSGFDGVRQKVFELTLALKEAVNAEADLKAGLADTTEQRAADTVAATAAADASAEAAQLEALAAEKSAAAKKKAADDIAKIQADAQSKAEAHSKKMAALDAAPPHRRGTVEDVQQADAPAAAKVKIFAGLDSAIAADMAAVDALARSTAISADEWARRTRELVQEQAGLRAATEGVRASVAEAARQDEERLDTAKQLAEIHSRPAGKLDLVAGLGADIRTQAAMTQTVLSEVEGDLARVNALALANRITPGEWSEEVERLGEAYSEAVTAADAMADAVAELDATEARPEALAAMVAQVGDVGLAIQHLAVVEAEAALQRDIARLAVDGITASERELIEVRMLAAEQQREKLEQAIEDDGAPQREAESLAALIMQLGELDAARQAQALAQEESTLRTDMERMAIDGLNAAEEREIATRLKSIDAMKADIKASAHAKAVKQQLGNIAKQTATSVLNAAISGSAASWKQLQEEMKAKAKGEAVNAVIELALAAGSYAMGNAAGGAAHMQSAGLHAGAAALAGGTAVLAGAMGGGGDDKKDQAPGDAPGLDTFRDVREGEREERGPRYEVAITGTLLGGQPEEVARQLSSYLAQFSEDTGGRSEPVRG